MSTQEMEALSTRIAAMDRPQIEEVYRSMRIPPRYREKSLLDLAQSKLVPLADIDRAEIAAIKGQNVVITGGVGAGKTHLAVCLLWSIARSKIKVGHDAWGKATVTNTPWRDVAFLSITDLVAELRTAAWKEHEAIEPHAMIGTLLLDDLGSEQRNETTRTWIAALLDRRYRYERQTIVTTNLTLQQLAEAVDDRAVSRLMEGGIHIQMTGPDYRLRKGGNA